MRKIWRGIKNTIFWSYERGSWPYDVMVVAIVAFVLLTPGYWFHDGPRSNESASQGITLIHEDPVSHTEILRVQAKLLSLPSARKNSRPEFERQMHELLGNSISDLKGRTFQIRSIDTIRAADGSVAYYDVDVKE